MLHNNFVEGGVPNSGDQAMIDNLSILLSHALLMYAFWLLTTRADLDVEPPASKDPKPEGFAKKRNKPNAASEPPHA